MIAAGASSAAGAHWIEAFQSSPAGFHFRDADGAPLERPAPASSETATLRFRLAVAAAGDQLRVRLSNEEGASAIDIAAASVALAAADHAAVPGSLRPLAFGGEPGVRIVPGAPALSDPVDLPATILGELLVSVHARTGFSLHLRGAAVMQAAPGDQTLSEHLEDARAVVGRPLVSGVSVLATSPARVIVAFGDSITDGAKPAVGDLRGWPEALQRRIAAGAEAGSLVVVNAGIAGNQLLSDGLGIAGLARLERDALRIAAASHIVILEGINDIGIAGRSPQEIVAAYRQVIARAHLRRIAVIGGTLLPFAGADYHSGEGEQTRGIVNRWIRTSGAFDGVIDFDAAMRDPDAPSRLRPAYDSGDRLHPNAAGLQAMGDAVDLLLFG